MNNDLSLPIPADKLIPHRPPFCLVDRLISFEDTIGVVESVITLDNILLNEDGSLEQLAVIEMIAQASAAVKGYTDLLHGRDIKKGFLVDVRRSRFTGQCFGGDRLRIKVETLKNIAGFSVIDGTVHRQGQIIATGTVKVWVPDEGGV